MSDLTGRTVLLTGASKGIGAATAEAMIAAGARLVAHYGSDRAGAEAATERAAEGQVTLVQADLSDPDGVSRLYAATREALGGQSLDVLVNNAGIMFQSGGIEDEVDEWDRAWATSMEVNVHSPAKLMRLVVRDWLASGHKGTVVGIGSWVTTRGTANPGAIAYAASKAAIAAATKTVARNYADKGILAYVIAPGPVATRMSLDSAAKTGGVEAVTSGLPMGEMIPPSEIADLAVFLATGQVRHLTGATLDVNGAAYIR
jgi:NAD(P)-dependent dehydrogenase (short-subunit alcohol dehydrogenase family)